MPLLNTLPTSMPRRAPTTPTAGEQISTCPPKCKSFLTQASFDIPPKYLSNLYSLVLSETPSHYVNPTAITFNMCKYSGYILKMH